MKELIIGSHVSFRKQEQLLGSTLEAISYDANTFMLYTGAPQNAARSPIDIEITSLAHKLMKEKNIDSKNVIVHAPYIINLASNTDFATDFLKQEIERVETLGLTKLVLHPGSHVKLGTETGLRNIIIALNKAIPTNSNVVICLETMAGKGTECGRNFEEIKTIIDGIHYKENIGVCLDTCHINDAGYDLNNFDEVLNQFDKIIGLNYLKCIHINDSKNIIGSKKDRHENFGFGTIGFDNLINIIYNKKLEYIPMILETPYIGQTADSKERLYPPYKFEIQMIRNKKSNPNLLDDIRNYYK
ncbi:MAG: deoxyribonuclease IV [Bacilli bacterium]